VRPRVAIVYNKPVPNQYYDKVEERAVGSILDSVEAVHHALLESGCSIVRVPLLPPLEQLSKNLKNLTADLLFNLFEGFAGYPETEAMVPKIASKLGIPYTGCSSEALSLALDKARTKAILEEWGIATPRYQLLNPETIDKFHLSYPCIVKPCRQDASHGLSENSVVDEFAALEKQVELISNIFGREVLVEEFIDGPEFNATIMGDSKYTVLPISEIDYLLPAGMPRILTFAAKWQPDSLYFQGTEVVCPAQVSDSERKGITKTTVAVFKLLCQEGYARLDMRLDGEGQLNVIEVNPNPDISPDSGAARQAKAAGMSYAQFINRIVELALDKGSR